MQIGKLQVEYKFLNLITQKNKFFSVLKWLLKFFNESLQFTNDKFIDFSSSEKLFTVLQEILKSIIFLAIYK